MRGKARRRAAPVSLRSSLVDVLEVTEEAGSSEELMCL